MVLLVSPTRGFHFDELEQLLLAGGVVTHLEHLQLEATLRSDAVVDRLLTFHDLEDE
jgi:hypothetical protein